MPRGSGFPILELERIIINPKKLETGLRTNSAGIPYTLLLRIEAIGFPTFGLLLYGLGFRLSWGSVRVDCGLGCIVRPERLASLHGSCYSRARLLKPSRFGFRV